MPQGLDVLKKYQEIIKNNPGLFLRDYLNLKENIEAAPIKHNGAAVGFLYNPLFYSQNEIVDLTQVCKQLADILDKVTSEFLKNPSFRELFDFPKELEELILIDPGYSTYFPMARFDIFYDFQKGSIKFCELNADGSSGMSKSLLLDQEFCKTEAIKKLRKNIRIKHLDPVETWVSALLKNYADFTGRSLEKVSIAIIDIDWSKQGMVTEFQDFQQRLKKLGHSVVICDPRELVFSNGKLYFQNNSIDLIYRRAVTADLLDIYADITGLITALKNQAVCMVGSFRSQVIHNKQIFAVLHQTQRLDFLSDQEKDFIHKYIPYTAIYKNSFKEAVLDKPAKWVLKPLDSYQSQGVYIGRDYTTEQWQEIVKGIPADKYLLQEFVEIPKLPLLDYQEKQLVEKYYNQMIGLFVYNMEFTGFYTRVSPRNNVASGLGAVAVPNLIVE